MSTTSIRNEIVPEDPITPEELVSELRRLRARIPDYQQLTGREAQGKVKVAYLDPEFINASAGAMGAFERSEATFGMGAEEYWGEISSTGRWSAVQDELKAMYDGVSSGNLARRNRIGAIALLVYEVLAKLVKYDNRSDLLPFVEAMRRAYSARRKRKKKDSEPPPQSE